MCYLKLSRYAIFNAGKDVFNSLTRGNQDLRETYFVRLDVCLQIISTCMPGFGSSLASYNGKCWPNNP